MYRRSAAAAYAALAVIVAAGATTGVDQWAVDHTMPFARFGGGSPTLLESLVPLLHAGWSSLGGAIANVVTVPGQFLVSLLILVVLRRWMLVGVWAAMNVVEVVCKHLLARHPVFHHGLHLVAFDHSFPSGHTLRTVLVAAAFARWWSWAWAVVSIVFVELAGYHVPTDIAGALLLAVVLLPRTTWTSWRSTSRSSRASRPSSRAR